MRRRDREVTDAEAIELFISKQQVIRIGFYDNGEVYIVPVNYGYELNDGAYTFYFHGAKAGHKIDSIKKHDKVSYCVFDAGFRKEGEWALNVTSVVVFGRISPLDDEKKAQIIGEHLIRKFTDDEEYIQKEVRDALPRAQCLELTIDHMTGKLVNES